MESADEETSPTAFAYMKAAEMEQSFYTKREIAEAFLTVGNEIHPDT